ncbi:MAG: prepilin peptidase [bacterium]|nr:prepilin peptidase [bacterium]
MEILAIVLAGIFGAIWGSFSVAQVWRLRAGQLSSIKKSDPDFNKNEFLRLKKLTQKSFKNDRSQCLNCGYQLKIWDLVPIFSWAFLRGRCRNCRTKIGWLEFLAEIFTALAFAILVFSGISKGWNFGVIFALILAILPLVILFIYDAKWSLLPSKLLWVFLILSGVFFLVSNFSGLASIGIWFNLVVSVVAFPIIYWALATFSKEKLVGGGDWVLALGLVMLLPNAPINGVLMMFASNMIALILAISMAILKKTSLKKGAQIPFGPSMILAWFILFIFWNNLEAIFRFLM